MNPQFATLFRLTAGAIMGCSIEDNELLKPRASQFAIVQRAEPGVQIKAIVEEFGEPHRREPNQSGGETLLYKTFVDWDKFVQNHLFWIETDESGQIVETFTEIDYD